MRHVKFTPEELAFDAPADTSAFKRIGRGQSAIFAKPPAARVNGKRTISLDPDVAAVFTDGKAVNDLLREVIRATHVVSAD